MQLKHVLIVAGVVTVMLFVVSRCEAGDYALYEGQMRAATIQHMLHKDACRTGPEAKRPLCYARVDAEWRKAMANVTASYRDTPAEWKAAEQVEREADARVRRIEAQKGK